jgi:hypothetical protein
VTHVGMVITGTGNGDASSTASHLKERAIKATGS